MAERSDTSTQRNQSDALHGQAFEVTAHDGFVLSATRFSAGQPKAQIVVGSALGVPQELYRRFAEFASARGFTTTTFDYRGIGRSRPDTLRGFDATLLDWASDLDAVLEHAAKKTQPLYYVCHSMGVQMLGLAHRKDLISASCSFGAGAGWSGWMPRSERLKLWIMWNLVCPPAAALAGYLPSKRLGLGEDIPLPLYKQWRHWCTFKRFFLDDPEYPELRTRCAELRTPLFAAVSKDDRWATPASRNAFVTHAFPNADLTLHEIDPTPFGKIGHMGYFRRGSEAIWADVLTRFEDHLKSGTSDDA